LPVGVETSMDSENAVHKANPGRVIFSWPQTRGEMGEGELGV